jgi:hypothetical protein
MKMWCKLARDVNTNGRKTRAMCNGFGSCDLFFFLPPVNRIFSLFLFVSALASQQGCRFIVARRILERHGEGQRTGKCVTANSKAVDSSELCSEDSLERRYTSMHSLTSTVD